jgi:hypothetical protein
MKNKRWCIIHENGKLEKIEGSEKEKLKKGKFFYRITGDPPRLFDANKVREVFRESNLSDLLYLGGSRPCEKKPKE